MKISKKGLVRLIESLLNEDLNHTIRSGETASGIAQRYNITLSQLRDANPNITNLDRIRAGDTLVIPDEDNEEEEAAAAINRNLQRDNIPRPAEEEDVDVEEEDVDVEGDYTDEEKTVACTLLGEIGSSISDEADRIEQMRNVFTVIHNRSENGKWNTGPISMQNIVTEANRNRRGVLVYQFSCWSEDPNMDVNDLQGTFDYWERERPNRYQEALDIVRSGEVSTEVGESVYYYAPSSYAPNTAQPIPDFADAITRRGTPCWEEIHDDGSHKFGISGRPWNNCVWGWVDQRGGPRFINRIDGGGRETRPAPQ